MAKPRLIIYGGSFDPIHQDHIAIALKAYQTIQAQGVVFVLCNNHPFNKRFKTSVFHRLNMLELGLKNHPQFSICTYEIDHDQTSYMVKTLHYLQQQYPDHKLYLLVGSDQLACFEKWYAYKEILAMVQVLCYLRKNVVLTNLNFPYIEIKGYHLDGQSSNLKLAPNKAKLNPLVLAYINTYGLYAQIRLQQVLSLQRVQHCLNVGLLAKELALQHNLATIANAAYVAGVYHDYAKEITPNMQKQIAAKLKIFNYPSWTTLHGYIGAYLIQQRFFINDVAILNAIRSHTIPFDFSPLAQLVYVADKICYRDDDFVQERKQWQIWAQKDYQLAFKRIWLFHQRFFNS